jgi:CheY-like chemotaxis protein
MAKAIASLARNAQAQNRVIEDLLDISRIITGKMQLKADPVDLRGAVDSAMEVIAPVAAAKGVRLTSDVPPVACVVQGDFDRLRQVIWNLLSNGVKFTPAGGSVCVDLSEDGDSYALAVSDTGIGISPEFLPHVFERFRQADGSMTREHGGLGLGLAIVKEVTELHAGRVTAAHGPGGVGATFTVVLPRLVGASFDAGVEEVYAGPPVRLDGVSILVIDDNADALEVAAATLTAAGARVRVAGSGPEGIEQMQRGMPDIVLCDLAMPGMDGFAVLKWIQAASSRPATPALAVTAYASADHRDVCLRAGFRGHVRKPYRTADLLHQVATILARV